MKKNIIIFLLGGLSFGMIGVGATLLYTAKDIEFIPNNTNWKVTSVDDAINDLYDNQVKVIYLGTGTSFDVKSKLPEGFDYSKLTNANFVVEATSKPSTTIGGYSNGGGSSDFIQGSTSLTKNYNSSTGVLSAYYNVYAIGHLYSGDSHWYTKPIDWNLEVKAYLIIGEIK